jgi:hypothetical protein
MTVITMSRNELTRLRVLIDVADGRLSVADATGLIGVGRRQVYRLLDGFRARVGPKSALAFAHNGQHRLTKYRTQRSVAGPATLARNQPIRPAAKVPAPRHRVRSVPAFRKMRVQAATRTFTDVGGSRGAEGKPTGVIPFVAGLL